ncbi:methyltransferase (plasmid) [Streptosporangium sp. NBC_01495]|uniref:methyltransferase n=1 Tax=Streptosporangium sp. NBC_01495 TaxID=2903899 RepID=UPI002E365DB8|nr:methyltransferase [Streptosporangium sp. NBC_01495]
MSETKLPRRIRATPPSGIGQVSARQQEYIQDIIDGVPLFGVLNAFCELGVADILDAAGEKILTVAEVAEQCGAIPDLLERILLPLAGAGIVTLTPAGVTLTELGAAVRRGVPGSMRDTVTWAATAVSWGAVPKLSEVLRTGQPILPGGKRSLYEYLEAHPQQRAAFGESMASRSRPVARALAAQDFSDVRTVVDVGGGIGMMLATVLEAHPHLSGVLQELSSVAERAEAAMAARGMADRWQVLPGDFFEGVPCFEQVPGKVVYLLSRVLRTLGDEDARRLLARFHAVMAMSKCPTELWCVDQLTLNALPDVTMMQFFPGGRERTSDQYSELLNKAGFALRRNTPLAGGLNLVVATLT